MNSLRTTWTYSEKRRKSNNMTSLNTILNKILKLTETMIQLLFAMRFYLIQFSDFKTIKCAISPKLYLLKPSGAYKEYEFGNPKEP